MNAKDKRRFIRELCNRIRDEMISKVANMPEEWDGHELRALLEDFAKESNFGACTSAAGRAMYQYRRTDRKRRKAYENECMVRAII